MTRKPSPTRAPKPPPFPVGARLRCVAMRGHSYAPLVARPRDIDKHPEDWVRIAGRGIEVTIDEVQPGRPGTGRQLRDVDGPMFYEDTGEPILDETRDGCSVYYVSVGGGERHGRLIHYKDRGDWERLRDASETCSSHPEDASYSTHEVHDADDGPRCAYCGAAISRTP